MRFGRYWFFRFGMASGLSKQKMRVLIVGHAYAASYNRIDKLARLACIDQIDRLGVVIPNDWHDRMMNVARHYEQVPEDQLYDLFLLNPIFNGSQSKHLYRPWLLNQVVQTFNPDLIHVEQELHDWLLGEVSLLNRWFWHQPIVSFGWENVDRRLDPLTRVIRRFNSRSVDYFIGGNQEAVQLAKKWGYTGQVTVIPQFDVDEKRFRPIDVGRLAEELNVTGKFVVGFVGRYIHEKGIHTLISAIEQVVNSTRIADFRVILLSSMPPPQWLHERIQKIQDKLIFLDQVPHEDFPRYMNLFDVLVLPSETQPDWKEQFGRVMIEAMACGVPVIGSSSGAIPEVIGNVGFVFPEGNANQLAHVLIELIDNPKVLTELAQRARDYVLSRYTHGQVVSQTVSVWQEVLKSYDKG